MKKLMLFVPFLCMVSVAVGDVSTRVCLADGNTPVEPPDANFPHLYGDFMVGTKLTIILDSNVAEYWSGSLAIGDHAIVGAHYDDGQIGILYIQSDKEEGLQCRAE